MLVVRLPPLIVATYLEEPQQATALKSQAPILPPQLLARLTQPCRLGVRTAQLLGGGCIAALRSDDECLAFRTIAVRCDEELGTPRGFVVDDDAAT